MRIKDLIKKEIQILNKNGIEEGRKKISQILQYVLKRDKNYLMIHDDEEIEKQKQKEVERYMKELIQGKPLQYITHTQEFMGLQFYVDDNVLIPQPDTEILVEETTRAIEKRLEESNKVQHRNKEKIKKDIANIKILDLCTGSGAIAISLVKYMKEKLEFYQENRIVLEIFATDISKQALEIARKNAKVNAVEIKFIMSNMFQKLEQYKNQFDIIVSNPPYIKTDIIETLPKEVQNEPHLALDGGIDGLKFYRMIADEACKYLKEDGEILLEIGYDQRESVIKLFKENKQYSGITCMRDLSGNDRVIKAKKAVFKLCKIKILQCKKGKRKCHFHKR